MIKDNCRGTFLRWSTHKFQPRYDESYTGPQWLIDHIAMQTELLKRPDLKSYKVDPATGVTRDYTKTYVQDVCIRCGSVVKR